MPRQSDKIRINIVMQAVNVNGAQLSRLCGVDRTLITRFQSGERRITRRSAQVRPLAEALLSLDTEGVLLDLLAPYMQQGESPLSAMQEYLMGEDLVALTPRTEAPKRQYSGDYVKQVRVFLGQRGFRRAAVAMLEYVATLPPGREIITLFQGDHGWLAGDISFVMQFLSQLRKIAARKVYLQVILPSGCHFSDGGTFAIPWLLAHLRGQICSRYYDGQLPEELRFAASIPGYWSACAQVDPEVEDGLYLEMHTDPRDTRQSTALCKQILQQSTCTCQYAFFSRPGGNPQEPPLWQPGPLPLWDTPHAAAPDGSFYALCRVPGFGMIRRDEFREILGRRTGPSLPDYFFPESITYSARPYRLIFCREDLQRSFSKQRFQHDAISALLGYRAFVSRDSFRSQIKRLLAAMTRDDFEVALVPRVAFEKLQLELVCWQGSAAVGWLQDASQSMFTNNSVASASLYDGLGYVWDKLLASWKRKSYVRAQLRKWLNGRELDIPFEDSTIVEHWAALPKE